VLAEALTRHIAILTSHSRFSLCHRVHCTHNDYIICLGAQAVKRKMASATNLLLTPGYEWL
jgi:hypothetical protein